MPTVKSASRVLDVLELLAEQSAPASLTQIAQALQMPVSSCYELLKTLQARGYVLRDQAASTYVLGYRLLQITSRHFESLDLIRVADPVMAEVNRICGEMVSLAILEGTDVLFIHKKAGTSETVQIVNPIGTRLPAHMTGLGKAILAELPPEAVDSLFPGQSLPTDTLHSISSKGALQANLAQIRNTGVAYDLEESRLGIVAVGSAILDHQRRPVAAISIALLDTYKRSDAAWKPLARLVKTAAALISRDMGCPNRPDQNEPLTLRAAWQEVEQAELQNQA